MDLWEKIEMFILQFIASYYIICIIWLKFVSFLLKLKTLQISSMRYMKIFVGYWKTDNQQQIVWCGLCWWASSCLGSAMTGVTAISQSEQRIEAEDQWEAAICLPPTWPSVRKSFNICFTFRENWENYVVLLAGRSQDTHCKDRQTFWVVLPTSNIWPGNPLLEFLDPTLVKMTGSTQ